jgi:hypothetical protein
MADISVLNTTAQLSGKTLVTEEGDWTIEGLWTFDRDPSAPFAVSPGSAKVSNLDADKLDGQEGSYYLDPANLSSAVPLSKGGTGAALTDPNADRLLDDSAGAVTWLTLGTGLSISDTTLNGSSTVKPTIVFLPAANNPPSSSYATLDTRNAHPVLDFDAGSDESAIFAGVLPTTYAGGGLTVDIYWAASSATSGAVKWNAEIERIDASSLDIDADSFASAQTATTTAAGTSGQVVKTSITFTDGAQMDSLAAGEAFRLRITRDANDAADTMTGDAEVLRVVVRET